MHPALIDARPLSTFTALPERNSPCVAPDIDDGTVACFGGQKIFSVPVDGESAACNSRTNGRFCSVNRIRSGNSLRSFFNYSAHGKKRPLYRCTGIKRQAVTRESRKKPMTRVSDRISWFNKEKARKSDRFYPIERHNSPSSI